MTRDFGALVDEGARVPVEGWDFSWFEARATEQRPPWGYQRVLSAHLTRATSALDLQTGGGEVLAGALRATTKHPRRLAATESWAPNLALAAETLSRWNATVVGCGDEEVPFADASF